MIAGNHDNPTRLEFGKELMKQEGLVIEGQPRVPLSPSIIETDIGEIEVWAVPFFTPQVLAEKMGREPFGSTTEAARALLESMNPGEKSILLMHGYVSGARKSGSERPLWLGGAEEIDSGVFKGFKYVALGHLHSPQRVRRGNIRYSGALMAYSFEEAGEKKGFVLAEMDGKGRVSSRLVPLEPKHPLKVAEGTMEEILDEARENGGSDAFVLARLLDPYPVFGAGERLREFYPNLLHVERTYTATSNVNPPVDLGRNENPDDLSLLDAFFKDTRGKGLSEEERAFLSSILDEMAQRERKEDRP